MDEDMVAISGKGNSSKAPRKRFKENRREYRVGE
jgi:hypothetical protein